MSDTIPALHIMLDIEALGLHPGAAITEIGAIAFSLETGKTGEVFHRYLTLDNTGYIDPETVEWHLKGGTWPPHKSTFRTSPEDALKAFIAWLDELGTPETFWSWGSTYDFPLLDSALDRMGIPRPWRYWQTACARTVWRAAFQDKKHDPRPHSALEDARSAAKDLVLALRHIEGRKAVA